MCEPICSDGLILGDEECEDDNTDPGDGCDADCLTEVGWLCDSNTPVSQCVWTCGNGIVEGKEQCDDGGGQCCEANCSDYV